MERRKSHSTRKTSLIKQDSLPSKRSSVFERGGVRRKSKVQRSQSLAKNFTWGNILTVRKAVKKFSKFKK